MATVNTSDPYSRVTWRGHRFDNRTVSAIKWAEKNWQAVAPKKRPPWRIGQGSYSDGSLSAGTHNGGGAVDIMFSGLTVKQRRSAVRWLRRAGFAAWGRTGSGWVGNEHVHGILRAHNTASWQAEQQVVAYDNHRNGLANNAYDGTWRPKRPRRWSHRQNKPLIG